ncbi:MAG: alpha/beta hydrolase [Candidatus Micrarchaeota archaeon]|nr:alpha/beta hydrolase [Candidatus Micrarchaeota archaeon]
MDYESDFEDGFENTSLGAMHYRYHPGTAEKLIFLHGLGYSVKTWSRLVEYLPDDLDVSLVDLLGHGESDAPEIEYTISAQFQALREFISMRNNGDSYIFGHSYGGWVAAYYASQPYTCKGIILEDSAGLKESFDLIIRNGGASEYKKTMLQSALKVNNNKDYVFRSILDSDFGEDQLTSEVLSKISARTEIIWGREDDMVGVRFAETFRKGIRNSSLDIIDNAGHSPHFTHPKEVSDILLRFMRVKE